MFDRSASPSGTTADRSAAGELLMWCWDLSSSPTPPSHPRIGQPHKSPVSVETSMILCKVWHLLTSEGTFFQIMLEWRQACHLIIQCGKREWKEEAIGAALWISRWVWRDTLWKKEWKRKKQLHCCIFFTVPCAWYLMNLLSSSSFLPPALSLPAFWMVTHIIVRASADSCLFLLTWIPNVFHTD